VQSERPVFLNLWQIKFPPMAIVSILHRISGVVLFLFLPLLLWLLHASLLSAESFTALMSLTHTVWMKLLLWILLGAVFSHLFAGIRHLIMDLGIGESLKAGWSSAIFVLVLSVLFIIAAGVWLWA
jgi:succinate dehydrogenase / fumarate reductase cytochrome b subunit